ncbi:MAG TPA: hypothetical protein VN634_22165 [Candidatus Limnocylindrales bacterium]|nr:hypothetical protein [Candidatus Limnocylindrales bacterium]
MTTRSRRIGLTAATLTLAVLVTGCNDGSGLPPERNCYNGFDDDENGLIDCEEPYCRRLPVCALPTTTTSTSVAITSTSVAITSTSSSTTSSTLGGALACHVYFRLTDDVTLGSLVFDTDYSAAPGEFSGSGEDVECTSLLVGTLSQYSDDDGRETLTAGVISLDGFTGPILVADCAFAARTTPVASDFAITVTEASTTVLVPVTPLPDVVVSNIDCHEIVGTTTIPSTIPPSTTEGPTDTHEPDRDYSVLFRLTSASAGAGALQFHTDYSAVPGGFVGTGAGAACTSLVSGALFAPNDVEAIRTLKLGMISLGPIAAPIDLARCIFRASDAPVPEDFPVVVDDATDTDAVGITAEIAVTAVTIVP